MAQSLRSRRWLVWLLVFGVVLVGVVVVVVLEIVGPSRTRDISHPYVEFSAPTAPPPAPPPATPSDPRFSWPVFGYDDARTHDLPLRHPLYPPYRTDWVRRGGSLLEFPPVLHNRAMFVLNDSGGLSAWSRSSGRVLWGRHLGSLAASSPAVGAGTVYVTILRRYPGARGGRIAAIASTDGHTRWQRPIPPSESSPLLARDRVIFGTQNGTVYALNSHTGQVRWRFKASGAVKGGLAADGLGRVFFGDYSGHVYALRQSDGHLLWRVGTSGAGFGFSSGQFYSTPAFAYGRVFIGNTDGFVYSFAADTGRLAWRTHTGGYVYGSPAVSDVAGGGPTVFVGSYDGHFYALNARSGRKRWVRKAGGRISGSAVVLGDMVWYSTLNHITEAVKARNGQPIFRTHRGYFNPIVSDGLRIYLVGTTGIAALAPMHRSRPPKPKPKPAPAPAPVVTVPVPPLAPLVLNHPPQPLLRRP
jgi:outer membrane protein assembly factor BamB